MLLFINLTVLIGIIHYPHYTISVNFYLYIQYFQQQKFQFQQNKQISNEPLVMHDMLRKIKQNLSGTSAVMLSLWTPIQKKKKLMDTISSAKRKFILIKTDHIKD